MRVQHTLKRLSVEVTGVVVAVGLAFAACGGSDGRGLHEQVRKPNHDAGCHAGHPTFPAAAVTAPAPDQTAIFRDEPGRALKEFLDGPRKGGFLFDLDKIEWLVLDRSDDLVVYGARANGVSYAIADRGHGTWRVTGWGGCDPRWLRTMTWSPQTTDPNATTLAIRYDSGSCGGQDEAPRAGKITVDETDTTVTIRVALGKPLRQPKPRPKGSLCGGVGYSFATTVQLQRPLGSRTLLDGARIPPGAPR